MKGEHKVRPYSHRQGRNINRENWMKWIHDTETAMIKGKRISKGDHFRESDVSEDTLAVFVELGYVESAERVGEEDRSSMMAALDKIEELTALNQILKDAYLEKIEALTSKNQIVKEEMERLAKECADFELANHALLEENDLLKGQIAELEKKVSSKKAKTEEVNPLAPAGTK
jgi:agmatine/peptidylarginine deiminase